jgi:hypothetical protein
MNAAIEARKGIVMEQSQNNKNNDKRSAGGAEMQKLL